jgi:hypothetical protein
MTLTDNIKIMEVLTPEGLANNTDENSDRIDMSGWDGVVFVVPITDIDDTGVATLTVEQNDSDSDIGMSALEDAEATATSATDDDLNDQLLIVDVYRPTKRYVQGVITSSADNVAFGNMIAILYNGSKFPISQDDTVEDIAQVASPAES